MSGDGRAAAASAGRAVHDLHGFQVQVSVLPQGSQRGRSAHRDGDTHGCTPALRAGGLAKRTAALGLTKMTRHTAACSRRWSDVPCPRPSGRRQGHRPPGVLPGVRTRAARTQHAWCRMGLPRRLHPHARGIGSLGTSTRDLNSLLRLGPMRPRSDGVRLHGSVRWRGGQLRVGPLPCLVTALPLAAVAALAASAGSGQLSGLRNGVPGRVSAGGYPTLQQAHHTEGPVRGEERARSINPATRAPRALVLAQVHAGRDIDPGAQGPVESAG